MYKYGFSVVVTTVLLFANSRGLEYNRQRFTQNTDFLQHEGGVNQYTPKNRNNPVADSTLSKSDFPALGPPSTSHTATPQGALSTQSSGKRDYVAPNFPPLKTPNTQQGGIILTNSAQPNGSNVPTENKQPSDKRDYVAPSYPTLRPPASTQPSHAYSQPSTRPAQTTPQTGKRDYVNPNLPASNPPTNSQQGKVKDLVNFYDTKSQQPNNPQKPFSYSSIVQGSNKNNQGSATNQPGTSPATKPLPLQTPKPFSFSDIVSGNKHNSPPSTNKPSTTRAFNTPSKPTTNSGTTRPLVLPSAIANNNKNNQGFNGNSVSEAELQTLSEELLRKDTNNAAKYITVNYQGRTSSQSKDDKAPLPLLTVSQEAWNIPTIQKFVALLDNYERDTLVNEYVTPQERNEENAFMDALMSTTVIRHLMSFFKDKGYVTPDPKQQRDFLKQLWFSLYSRGKGKISSSGFEHSFVSELKNGEVSGLHNWIYFTKEEQANRLNYLGYLKYEELNGKGAVIKLHFNQQGVDKPVDSLFVGTSPELEIALYTLCFVTRVDNDCHLKLADKDINIITYNFRYRSKNLIGSAYPQI